MMLPVVSLGSHGHLHHNNFTSLYLVAALSRAVASAEQLQDAILEADM